MDHPVRGSRAQSDHFAIVRVISADCLDSASGRALGRHKTFLPPANGKGPTRLPYGDYFAALYHYPFDEIHANVFDQLVTPVAYYLREDEVRPWLASGFQDAALRSHRGYSWTGLATVCRTKAAVAE